MTNYTYKVEFNNDEYSAYPFNGLSVSKDAEFTGSKEDLQTHITQKRGPQSWCMFRQPLPTMWLLLPTSGDCFTPTRVVTDGKKLDNVVAVDTKDVAAKEEEEDDVEDIFMIGLFD